MENIFQIEIDGVKQYPINSQKAVNSSNGINIDNKFTEVDERITTLEEKPSSGDLPVNENYSVLKDGEFTNLFEKKYQGSKTISPLNQDDGTPIPDSEKPYWFQENGLYPAIFRMFIPVRGAGSITFGLNSYNYRDANDAGLIEPFTNPFADFEEELFTITFSESDITPDGSNLVVGMSSSKISNRNPKYWDEEGGYFLIGDLTLGFKQTGSVMETSGVDELESHNTARFQYEAATFPNFGEGTVTEFNDVLGIGFETRELKYISTDLITFENKQELIIDSNIIKLTKPYLYKEDRIAELIIDNTDTKGNVNFTITNNGLTGNVDLSGTVESVNGQTGVVNLTASNVNAYNKSEIDDKILEVNNKIKVNYSFIKEFIKTDVVNNKLIINHQLNSFNLLVNVYDDINNQIIPNEITLTDVNNVTIDLTDFVDTIENTYKVLILSIEGVKEIINKEHELPINENYSVIHNGQYVNLFEKDEFNNYLVPEIKELSESAKTTNQTSETIIKTEYNIDGSINQVLQPIDISNLPTDFPQYTITGESSVKSNFYVCPDSGDEIGWLMILNYKGELLWYKNTGSYTTCFRRYVNSKGKNRYCYLTNINDEFPRTNNFYYNTVLYVLDENFIEVDRVYMCEYNSVENNSPTENHDYIFIDDGHYILANYYRIGEVDPYYNQIQEIKNRKLIWAIDTLDYPELRALSHTNTSLDPTHFNSIIEDYDGNYIISFRNVGLVKFKKSDKSVMWVIGENQCDFTGIDTSMIPFQQHDIKVVYKDGSYTIFDNYGHSSKSRILRYWLNENTMTATVKEYVTTYDRSGYMGSAVMVDFENEIFDIAYGSAFDVAFQEYNFKTNTQVMLMKFNDKSDTYRVWRDL